MAYAGEYTPEVTEDFYNRLAQRIQKRGGQDVGLARSEALSRGLQGDPYEGSAVGAARRGAGEQLGDLESSLAYNVAGLQREERLGKEGQAYESAESEKSRAFQERMAKMYQAYEADQANTQYRRSYQSALWQAPLNLLTLGMGSYLGGRGAAAGKAKCDRNLKTDIRPLTTVKGLTLYAFKYKAGVDAPRWDFYGFMAQDVQKVAPEAVRNDGGVLTIDTAKLAAYLGRE